MTPSLRESCSRGRMSWAQIELTNPTSKVLEGRRGTGQIRKKVKEDGNGIGIADALP